LLEIRAVCLLSWPAGRPVPAATLIVEGEAVALRDRMKR